MSAHPILQSYSRANSTILNNSENMDAKPAKQLQKYENFCKIPNIRVRNQEDTPQCLGME